MATEHFTWTELGSPPPRHRRQAKHLAEHLERLRSIVARPIPLRGAYRSASLNRKVGGAARSQHLLARAADIPAGIATIEQAVQAGFTGIGDWRGWAVHVDTRLGPPARWTYP